MTETTRRSSKNRKSAGFLLAWVLLGVGALTLILMLAGRGMVTRMGSAKQLDEAIRISREADVVVLRVDELSRAKVASDTTEKIVAARSEIPSATAALKQAITITDGAFDGLNDDERKQATVLREADTARIELLNTAGPLLAVNERLAKAAALSSAAYTALGQAEKEADTAVRNYNKLTKAGAQKSLAINQEARKKLVGAKRDFESALAQMPEADLKPFITYTAARIAVVDASIAADKAYLAGKTQKANDLSTRFNKAERAASTALSKLPRSPADVLALAYDRASNAAQIAFFTAREKVSVADKRLREQ